MKRLLAIWLLLSATFVLKAQDMIFEETVKYINDKRKCCAMDTTPLIASKNGTLKWTDASCNLFDLFDTNSSRDLISSNGISIFFIRKQTFLALF